MRVLMFPGHGNRGENRYIDILRQAISSTGTIVQPWVKEIPYQSGDVFHFHWPELVTWLRLKCHPRIRGEWINRNFISTINRIRDRGGAIVWTVHDLKPHEQEIENSEQWAALKNEFLPLVDRFISLTENGIPLARNAYALSPSAPFSIARHPHYLNIFTQGKLPSKDHDLRSWRNDLRDRYRLKLNIQPNTRLISILGYLRENKGVTEAISQLKPILKGNVHLLVAGGSSNEYRERVKAAIGVSDHIHYIDARLNEDDLVGLHCASDAVIFGGRDYFNSGAIYTAISLGTPVIVEDSSINRELASLIPKSMMHINRNDAKGWDLNMLNQASALGSPLEDWMLALKPFDPMNVATQHLEAYTYALLHKK